jgi:hypothetical protein
VALALMPVTEDNGSKFMVFNGIQFYEPPGVAEDVYKQLCRVLMDHQYNFFRTEAVTVAKG